VVVVRNGKLVFQYYREGLGPSTLHDMRSATMCVISTLVGVAVQKGLIRSVDQPMADFLPEALGEGVDPRVRTMTLAHILTMTAGFDPAIKQIGRWAFPVDFALQRPLVSNPGATFSFNAGTAHLAARVLVSATQESVSQFAQEQLFGPLESSATDGKSIGQARASPTPAVCKSRRSIWPSSLSCNCSMEFGAQRH
jgi:CubicO group peptidase (beta-lactamase class C family)